MSEIDLNRFAEIINDGKPPFTYADLTQEDLKRHYDDFSELRDRATKEDNQNVLTECDEELAEICKNLITKELEIIVVERLERINTELEKDSSLQFHKNDIIKDEDFEEIDKRYPNKYTLFDRMNFVVKMQSLIYKYALLKEHFKDEQFIDIN